MVITRKKISIEVDIPDENREEIARSIVKFLKSEWKLRDNEFNVLIIELEPKTQFILKNGSPVIHSSF